MMPVQQSQGTHDVAVEIGGMPIVLRTQDADFRTLLEDRYVGFVRPSTCAGSFSFDVDVMKPERYVSEQEELKVWLEDGIWRLERGDFRAQWDPRRRPSEPPGPIRVRARRGRRDRVRAHQAPRAVGGAAQTHGPSRRFPQLGRLHRKLLQGPGGSSGALTTGGPVARLSASRR